jgi:hypothetical protein
MCTGVLPAANSESDQPQNEQDGGRDPQQMHRETDTEQDQHEQQSENQ